MIRRYLIKWYPVYPWDDYQIIDLDILKPEFDSKTIAIGLKNFRERVQELYNEYQSAFCRHGLNKYGIVGYNNSWWCVIEAENAILANDIFKQKLEQDWNDHEESPKKMSVEEIENKLGYPIEIVSKNEEQLND